MVDALIDVSGVKTATEIAVAVVAVYAAFASRPKRTVVDWPRMLVSIVQALGNDEEPLDLRGVLGPKVDLAVWRGWGPEVHQGLARRFDDTVWATVGGTPLAGRGPELRSIEVDSSTTETLADSILDGLSKVSERVLLVAEGGGVLRALQALEASPDLRDRLRAVVFWRPVVDDAFRAWLEAHFTQAALDTELQRAVPYVVVEADPATGVFEGKPPSDETGRECVDLIAVSLPEAVLVDDERAARAIWTLLACRLMA